jgi:hypothetical protein
MGKKEIIVLSLGSNRLILIDRAHGESRLLGSVVSHLAMTPKSLLFRTNVMQLHVVLLSRSISKSMSPSRSLHLNREIVGCAPLYALH